MATNTYADSNERLIAEEFGQQTSVRTYYVGEGGATIAEYTESGGSTNPVWSKSYVYLGNRLLATLTPNSGTPNTELVQYHHPDRLGTRLVTDPSNGTSFEQVTLPFGTALESESSGQTYCTNDPVNHTDPSGLGFFSFLKKLFKIIAIVVAVVLIVIAVVTLGQVPLLTTLQYLLSAGSSLAFAFGKRKVGMILAAASFGLGALSGQKFGFSATTSETGESRLAKILMTVGPIAGFLATLGDEPGPGKRRRRRERRKPPATVIVILVSPPEKQKPTWTYCFSQCAGSIPEGAKEGCIESCQDCARDRNPAACAICTSCGLTVFYICILGCCAKVGCPADK